MIVDFRRRLAFAVTSRFGVITPKGASAESSSIGGIPPSLLAPSTLISGYPLSHLHTSPIRKWLK